MKTRNSYHWVISLAALVFSFQAFSMGNGGGGSRTLTCSAGYKVETVRSGRTYTQQCVVDSALMSSPEYNRESNRTVTPSSPSAPAKKPNTAKKPTKPNKVDCGDDSKFRYSEESKGCVAIRESGPAAEEPAPDNSVAGAEEAGFTPAPNNRSSVLDGVRSRSICGPDAFLVTSSTPNSDSAAVGDFNGRSTNDGKYEFCRKNGVSQADADAANKQGSSDVENCRSVSGTEFVRDNVRYCRFADRQQDGKQMVCSIDPRDNSLQDCERDQEAKVAEAGSCEQRFNEARNVCFAQADKASTDCDQENQGIQDAMNATKAVGAGAAVSMQLACSKLGEISKIANASLTGWQTFCAFSQSGCETACSDAKIMFNDPNCIPEANKRSYTSDMTTIQQNVNVCLGYKKRISEAAQHATAALVQLQAAKKCEEDTSALTTANVDECKKNPNNPLCTDAQKCSNAAFAASNKVCQCINNPNSKDCIANNGLAGSRGVAGATIPGVGSGKNTDPGSALIPPASGSGTDAFATSLQNGVNKNEQNLGGAKGSANLGGSGGGGGGGGAGLGSGAGGGAGVAGDDKLKINSGFYGGATGGGGYLGKPGGAYGSGRLSAGGVNYNKLGAGGAQFDPRRYIAGLNGKTGEYINGPNMDIFRIVKNRIESKKPTMLDPDFKK